MDPMTAIAGINAGLSLFNSGANRMAQERQNQQNMMAQRIENHLNRQFQLDMWNKNNEYNLPINQMSRLRDAGINPHLAYSNGTPMNVSNAPASSSASAAAQGVAPRYENVSLGELAQLAMTKAQVDNIKADTDKKKAETENTNIIAGINQAELNVAVERKAKELTGLELSNDFVKQNIENAKQQLENMKSQKNLTDAQVVNLSAVYLKTIAEINNINEKTKTEKYVRSNLQADTYMKTEIAKGQSIKNAYDIVFGAQERQGAINLNNANVENVLKDTYKKGVEAGLIKANITYQDWKNMFAPVSMLNDEINKVSNTYKNYTTGSAAVLDALVPL